MGLAYAVVTNLSALLLRDLGQSTAAAITWSSLLGVPFVVKPLYAPAIELGGSLRSHVVGSQLCLGLCFLLAALLAGSGRGGALGLVICLSFIAFFGSVQDVASEGLFLTSLDRRSQAVFSGIQSIFWNGAALIGGGAMVALSGVAGSAPATRATGWTVAMTACGLLYAIGAAWHRNALPKAARVPPAGRTSIAALTSFASRPHLRRSLVVCFVVPFGVGMTERVEAFFLVDPSGAGGLGLSRETLAAFYAAAGFVGLVAGAASGSIHLGRASLPRALPWMSLACAGPSLLYFALAIGPPAPTPLVAAAFLVSRAMLAYGMVGYVVFLQRALAPGAYPTTHYNLASALKALSTIIAGLVGGLLQPRLGYAGLFAIGSVWSLAAFVIVCSPATDEAVADPRGVDTMSGAAS